MEQSNKIRPFVNLMRLKFTLFLLEAFLRRRNVATEVRTTILAGWMLIRSR